MIVHVVLFGPRADLAAADRQSILDSLTRAATGIPSIRRCRVGRRIRHGRPGYEQAMRDDLEYCLLVEFDDVEGLTTYLAHPAHAAFGLHFAQSAAAALAYDYEMLDAADAAGRLG